MIGRGGIASTCPRAVSSARVDTPLASWASCCLLGDGFFFSRTAGARQLSCRHVAFHQQCHRYDNSESLHISCYIRRLSLYKAGASVEPQPPSPWPNRCG